MLHDVCWLCVNLTPFPKAHFSYFFAIHIILLFTNCLWFFFVCFVFFNSTGEFSEVKTVADFFPAQTVERVTVRSSDETECEIVCAGDDLCNITSLRHSCHQSHNTSASVIPSVIYYFDLLVCVIFLLLVSSQIVEKSVIEKQQGF